MSGRRWIPILSLAVGLAGAGAPPARAATLYGLINTGELFESVDDGVTWTPLATLPVRDATALAARLTASDLFLTSRSGSVYRSTDAGASWIGVGAITAADVEDLLIRPDGTLLALTASGSVYASADLGATFTALAALTGSNFVSLAATAPAVRAYAMTRTGEVYESEDGGVTWAAKGAFAASDAVRLRSVGLTLYALTGTGDLYRSTDRAVTWTAVSTLSQVGMRGLVRNGASLAAATREGHVAISDDGVAWTWQGSMQQLTLTALASNEPATTSVGEESAPGRLAMGAPYPNPSARALSFTLRLERASQVRLALYDAAGRRVAARVTGLGSGSHSLAWDPGPLAAGVHTLRAETDDHRVATRRWVVVR